MFLELCIFLSDTECADDLRDLCPNSVRVAAGRFGAMTVEHALHA